MDRSKNLIVIGSVFMSCGVSFMGIGIATEILTFSILGPVFMTLGVVLLATSGVRSRPGTSKTDSTD